MKKNEMKDCD